MHAFNIYNMLRPKISNFIPIAFNELSANVLQDLQSNFFVAKYVVEP